MVACAKGDEVSLGVEAKAEREVGRGVCANEEAEELREGDWVFCKEREDERGSGEREESCVLDDCIVGCVRTAKEIEKAAAGFRERRRMKSESYVLQGSDGCGQVECKG